MKRAAVWLLAGSCVSCLPPEWGAEAILHPARRPVTMTPDVTYEDVSFAGTEGAVLRGWRFRTRDAPRGLLVYLHGIGDNREGGVGIAKRFGPKGWDVLAYDGRAHGASGGAACTYGVLEKHDLVRALDAAAADRVVLFGCSLGAAVALQAAPLDPRIRGVIAQSPFSSLPEIARDRAPWFATASEVERALALAGSRGGFEAADASPATAARAIRVPVLLIHGEADRETGVEHSRRTFEALAGPRRLFVVPGAGHTDTLRGSEVWAEIEGWLAALDPGRGGD
jgi:pimeloyl-ACP methyl ester carboxylesterase